MKAVDPSSAMGIAEGQGFSHDSVYRVLQEDQGCFRKLALAQLEKYGSLKGSYLVLDDSFSLRYSSGKLKLKKLKDSARGGYPYGFNVVMLVWTDGKLRLPLGFRVFTAQKAEASKSSLALELCKEAQTVGLTPRYVLFDAWYTAQQMLNWLANADWLFVTQLRKNRHLDACPLQSERRPYWVKVGKLNRLAGAVLVIGHRKRYLCSNDTCLERQAIPKLYRFRQQIEETFRCLKQALGWRGIRFRTLHTLTAHLALTLGAYALSKSNASNSSNRVTSSASDSSLAGFSLPVSS